MRRSPICLQSGGHIRSEIDIDNCADILFLPVLTSFFVNLILTSFFVALTTLDKYVVNVSISAKEETTCFHENKVKVFANGSCIWYREFQHSVTHCPMDVTWFPFDEQDCDLKFESKTRESKELNVTADFIPISEKDHFYDADGEWDLIGKADGGS